MLIALLLGTDKHASVSGASVGFWGLTQLSGGEGHCGATVPRPDWKKTERTKTTQTNGWQDCTNGCFVRVFFTETLVASRALQGSGFFRLPHLFTTAVNSDARCENIDVSKRIRSSFEADSPTPKLSESELRSFCGVRKSTESKRILLRSGFGAGWWAGGCRYTSTANRASAAWHIRIQRSRARYTSETGRAPHTALFPSGFPCPLS